MIDPRNIKLSKIEIDKDKTNRIQKLIKEDSSRPFENIQDFVNKALEIWLAWEEEPERVVGLMNRYDKTKKQNEMMELLMHPEKITIESGQTTIKNDQKPASFGRDLVDLLIDDRDSGCAKLKLIREALESTKKYIEEKKHYNLPKETELCVYDEYEDEFPLLWRYYSRIFPAKLIITVLAYMMYIRKTDYVRLSDLRTEGLSACIGLSVEIEKFEKNNNIKKPDKISTGFPNHEKFEEKRNELIAMDEDWQFHQRNIYGTDTFDNANLIAKEIQINQRFQDRFIGKGEALTSKKGRTSWRFEGILSALGIVKCFMDDDYYVTLTESGKKFFLLSNPLIEKPINDKSERIIEPFSDKEIDLIMKEMLGGGKLRLEKDIIDFILKKMRPRQWYDADIITEWMYDNIKKFVKKKEKSWPSRDLFETELENYVKIKDAQEKGEKSGVSRISAWRAATMGRLSELRKIKWQINSKGKSEYSLYQA